MVNLNCELNCETNARFTSSALRDVAAGEKMNKAQRQGCESNSGGGGGCAPLVQLLQDGLKDGNVEAQE